MSNDLLMPIRRLHGRMYEANKEFKEVRQLCKRIKDADKSTVLFVLSPSHGNLGDHAIALSIIELLTEMKIKFIEITTVQLFQLKKYHKLGIMNKHRIIVNGGGNLGTLWFNIENLFRCIIRENPDSPIFCFPNTIFYEKTEYGNKELENSKDIYNHHQMLKLYAREKTSFDFMKELYYNVKLIPDMVLFLNKSQKQKNRVGCLLCLRNDCERTRTDEQERQILTSARRLFNENVKYTDMCLNHGVSPENRKYAVEEKFDEFKGAQLVITDRLHGMIFSAVTGTPCIVIESKSPKIRGCYEWVKNLDYICFADNVEQIEALYKVMPKNGNQYDNSELLSYRDILKKDILLGVDEG